MIRVEDLHKRFGAIEALRGVSFTAPDGGVTGLLGPNGAGKTTALRIIYTALKPDAGRALVDGHDVGTSPQAAQERIGALPHSRGLYGRLSARENIAYYGRLHGMSAAAIAARTDALVELLGMQEIADRRTAGFSEGQRVKVAIARSLVHDPQNAILDEPTTGLDVMSTRAMRDFIRSLRDAGKCVLLSSHVMQEVAALCDHIIVIARGQIAATGTPDELRARTGQADLEEAFVSIIGSAEGLQ